MSNIPPLYEGTPLRGDGFILTFAPLGTITVGNVVTAASANTTWSVQAANSLSQFLLGVALTTGGLAGGAQATFGAQGPTPISVITRGIVDVVADATTIAVGDFLVPSTTAGAVHSIGSGTASASVAMSRAYALSPSTATGTVIQAFLF